MAKLPPLNAIRAFEAAARHENFTRAADELHVTQSAVSRQVHVLEEHLGQALFVRKGPRVTLTAAGREYYRIVQQGFAVLTRGTDRLFRRGGGPVLTLSTVPSVISKWLVPRLHEFERKHPKITLHLTASHQRVDFSVATDIDVAIRWGEGQWPGVTAELLVEDVIFPVCSPEVARALKRPKDILAQRLFGDHPKWDLWGVWLEAVGIEQRPAKLDRLSNDFNVQHEAAIMGRGVSLTRGLFAADDLRSGRLVCPFPVLVPSPVHYYFVYSPDRGDEPPIRALRDWLLRSARETVAETRALVEQR